MFSFTLNWCDLSDVLSRPLVDLAFLRFSWQLEDASTHSERLDASVFMSMLPEIGRRSRTCTTRATDVFLNASIVLEDADTRVYFTSPRKSADKMRTIAHKRWHGAIIFERRNARSTYGLLKLCISTDNNF